MKSASRQTKARNGKRAIQEPERRKIIALRNAGKKYAEIAKIVGRSTGTISSVLSLAILDGKTERLRYLSDEYQRRGS